MEQKIINEFKEQFGEEIDAITYALNTTLRAKRLDISYPESCYRLGLQIGRFNEANESSGYRMQWCIGTSYIYVFEGCEETGWHCKYVIKPSGVDDYSSKYMRKI